MADRPRDLWDALAQLTVLTQPDIQTTDETLDAYQAPSVEVVPLSDSVTLPYLHHTGVYTWGGGLPLGLADDPATIWGRFQWG